MGRSQGDRSGSGWGWLRLLPSRKRRVLDFETPLGVCPSPAPGADP